MVSGCSNSAWKMFFVVFKNLHRMTVCIGEGGLSFTLHYPFSHDIFFAILPLAYNNMVGKRFYSLLFSYYFFYDVQFPSHFFTNAG